MEYVTLSQTVQCEDCGKWLQPGTKARKYGNNYYCLKPHPKESGDMPATPARPAGPPDSRVEELDHFISATRSLFLGILHLIQEYIELTRK